MVHLPELERDLIFIVVPDTWTFYNRGIPQATPRADSGVAGAICPHACCSGAPPEHPELVGSSALPPHISPSFIDTILQYYSNYLLIILLNLDESFQQAYKFYKSAREGSIHRCQELYRDSDGPLYYDDAFLVHNFQDRLARWSDCPLCRFFQTLRVQPGRHRNYKLLAFCSSESWIFKLSALKKSDTWDKAKHTVFMAVVPDVASISPRGHEEHWLERDVPAVGSIYQLRPEESDDINALLRPREVGAEADFSVLREWHFFCQIHHGSACKRRESHEPVSRGFRVINCAMDPPVVEAQPWGITYAALSYVWGKRPADMEEWPKTVLDAVTVMREMGLQYLWVDRLCINQSDPVKKGYLISRMTTIYEEADFTIVAAAGCGASYGLPGVRSTPRKPQPKCTLESGSMLVSTLQDPRRHILESEYWTRGWTYQEGVLSNQRLVFTDYQAYWECRCMAIHESIDLPLRLVHEASPALGASGIRMSDFMLTGIFKGDSYSGGVLSDRKDLVIAGDANRLDYGFPIYRKGSIRAQTRGLNEHIRAFSMRKLSYDTDSLAAFLGIAGMYGSNEMIHLFLGIPMWMGDIVGDLAGAQITFALSICSWYHRSGSDHQMFVAEPCRRRSHLPSWTWAGWNGSVIWRAPPSDEHCVFMSDLIEIDTLHLVWAADIYLLDANRKACIRLLNTYSAEDLESEGLTLLEIKKPLLLKYYNRHAAKHEWVWRRLAGRDRGERYYANRMNWDRIAGRLASVNLSVSMTEEQWTEQHASGELISVLMFAGKFPSVGHGRARFLTLRKVESPVAEPRWERVGTVQLVIPNGDLSRCMTNTELLKRIPVYEGEGVLVIQ
ncbi:hypothetical protein AUP68_16949 [Ilyonectria robusta]